MTTNARPSIDPSVNSTVGERSTTGGNKIMYIPKKNIKLNGKGIAGSGTAIAMGGNSGNSKPSFL